MISVSGDPVVALKVAGSIPSLTPPIPLSLRAVAGITFSDRLSSMERGAV